MPKRLYPITIAKHGPMRSEEEARDELRAKADADERTAARKRRRRAPDYSHMDPADLTEDGVPHDDYSSPSIEPHPFGGGISAGDY